MITLGWIAATLGATGLVMLGGYVAIRACAVLTASIGEIFRNRRSRTWSP